MKLIGELAAIVAMAFLLSSLLSLALYVLARRFLWNHRCARHNPRLSQVGLVSRLTRPRLAIGCRPRA